MASVKDGPVGDNDADKLLNDLREAKMKLRKEQQKFDLLRNLQRKGLMTRDIMSFISQQSNARSFSKKPDKLTARRAMSAKINDAYNSIIIKKETVRNIKKACLAVLDNKRFKLRKHMKRMGIQADKHHRDRDEKNNRKIKHLESLQKDIFGPDINSKAVKPNKNKKRLPNRLLEYEQLKLLDGPDNLPKPLPPVGPFVCHPGIKLTKEELRILNKDPKFSLMPVSEKVEFSLENEKSLAKFRFGKQVDKKNSIKSRINTSGQHILSTGCDGSNSSLSPCGDLSSAAYDGSNSSPTPCGDLSSAARDGSNSSPLPCGDLSSAVHDGNNSSPPLCGDLSSAVCDGSSLRPSLCGKLSSMSTRAIGPKVQNGMCLNVINERARLEKLWNVEKHRYIFNPFSKEIDFRYRRPTDYKLNKRIFLPRPLNELDEFQCELKRRQFNKVFDNFVKENTEPTDDGKNGLDSNNRRGNKNVKQYLNLSFKERIGLKTLNDRIDSGEIMITPTDKSGRFAVLTKEQYIKSGEKHTSKDQKINWRDLKYMKNQVNNHMYWYGNIFRYCDKTNPERMRANLVSSDLQLPEMAILVKDHKQWQFDSGAPVPSRPVVSGNSTINTHLSELISEIVEPIALHMNGCEVQSSEEALSLIDKYNEQHIMDDGPSFHNSTPNAPQLFHNTINTSHAHVTDFMEQNVFSDRTRGTHDLEQMNDRIGGDHPRGTLDLDTLNDKAAEDNMVGKQNEPISSVSEKSSECEHDQDDEGLLEILTQLCDQGHGGDIIRQQLKSGSREKNNDDNAAHGNQHKITDFFMPSQTGSYISDQKSSLMNVRSDALEQSCRKSYYGNNIRMTKRIENGIWAGELWHESGADKMFHENLQERML